MSCALWGHKVQWAYSYIKVTQRLELCLLSLLRGRFLCQFIQMKLLVCIKISGARRELLCYHVKYNHDQHSNILECLSAWGTFFTFLFCKTLLSWQSSMIANRREVMIRRAKWRLSLRLQSSFCGFEYFLNLQTIKILFEMKIKSFASNWSHEKLFSVKCRRIKCNDTCYTPPYQSDFIIEVNLLSIKCTAAHKS